MTWVEGLALAIIGSTIFEVLRRYAAPVARRWLRRSVVKIVSPRDGAEVGRRGTVRGTIRPPGLLQVFVFSNDGYWHRQDRPELVRDAWTVECGFGDDRSKPNSSYEIIAIAGEPVEERRVRDLPADAARSKRVRVWRP